MTEVKRKKGESFEALLRRFNGRVQKSGRLLQAKKIRFQPAKENKAKKKQAALKREDIKDKIIYLLRAGKIKEEDLKKRDRKNKINFKKLK